MAIIVEGDTTETTHKLVFHPTGGRANDETGSMRKVQPLLFEDEPGNVVSNNIEEEHHCKEGGRERERDLYVFP